MMVDYKPSTHHLKNKIKILHYSLMLNLETRGEISSHSLLKVIKVDPTILFFNMNSL